MWSEGFRWLIEESSKFDNLDIYGFDDMNYADNIANYRDSTHYNTDMNKLQLDSIKNKTHILTPQNIESYLDIMQEKIKSYNIDFIEVLFKQ